MSKQESTPESPLSSKAILTIFSAVIASVIGLNAWLIQRSLSRPIEGLSIQISSLSKSLNEFRLDSSNRITAVEKDVEDNREDMKELKGRVSKLEDSK